MIVIFETSESDYFNLEGTLKIKTKKKKKKKIPQTTLTKLVLHKNRFHLGVMSVKQEQ